MRGPLWRERFFDCAPAGDTRGFTRDDRGQLPLIVGKVGLAARRRGKSGHELPIAIAAERYHGQCESSISHERPQTLRIRRGAAAVRYEQDVAPRGRVFREPLARQLDGGRDFGGARRGDCSKLLRNRARIVAGL